MKHAVRPSFCNVLRWSVAAAVALFSGVSHAQSDDLSSRLDAAFQRYTVARSGATATVSPSPVGVLVRQTTPAINVVAGDISVSRALTVAGPGTAGPSSFEIVSKANLSRAAFAKLAVGALRVAPYLAAGVAVYDLVKAYGWRASKDASGNLVLERPDPSVCTQAPCYQYQAADAANGQWYSTPSAAAAAVGNQCDLKDRAYGITGVVSSSPSEIVYKIEYCEYSPYHPAPWTATGQIRQMTADPAVDSAAFKAAALADFEEQVKQYGIPPALDFDPSIIVVGVTASGSPIPMSDMSRQTISGPASTPIRTTTTTNPDGTITTTTVTDRHTYSGDSVTTNTETKTETLNPATGQTSTTTSTTTDQAATNPQSKDDPCANNPDRVGCMSAGQAPQAEQISDKKHEVTVTPVSFFNSAACPAPIPITVYRSTYMFTWDPLCNAMVFLKVIILVIAGMAAAWILSDTFRV